MHTVSRMIPAIEHTGYAILSTNETAPTTQGVLAITRMLTTAAHRQTHTQSSTHSNRINDCTKLCAQIYDRVPVSVMFRPFRDRTAVDNHILYRTVG